MLRLRGGVKPQHEFPEDAMLPLIWQRTMWNYLIFSSCVKVEAENREGAAE